MKRSRGREAEARQPISRGLAGEALVRRGAFEAPPAPGSQIVISAEEIQEPLGDALVHIEERPQGGIEPFYGAGGSMSLVQ